MHGTLQQCAVFIEKPKIHSPCINTYTVKSAFCFALQFLSRSQRNAAAYPSTSCHSKITGSLEKSVHFFHPDLSVFQTSEDCPSASSAKVEREYLSFLIAHSRTSFHPRSAQGICISVAGFYSNIVFQNIPCVIMIKNITIFTYFLKA